jgi:hypothetical protein
MVQMSSLPNRIAFAKNNKVRLQSCIAIGATIIVIVMFFIESNVYRQIQDNDKNTFLDHQHQQQYRRRQTEQKYHFPMESNKQHNTPTSRNGFVTRGSLRSSALIVDVDKYVLEHVDQNANQQHQNKNKIRHQTTPLIKNKQQNADKKKRNKKIQVNSIATRRTSIPPRIIMIDKHLRVHPGTYNKDLFPLPVTKLSSKLEQEEINGDNHQEADYYILDYEKPYMEECSPILKPTINPTCNTLHEMTIMEGDISLISTKGSWRSVWQYNKTTTEEEPTSSSSSSPSSVALKMLHLHRNFDKQSFEAHATDIMVMDRLTASPYVVNAYGFCGQTVITEFATSTGREYVKRYDIGSRDRLRVARDLAQGLADIQALKPLIHAPHEDVRMTSPLPVFAHNDINIANTVMINGRMKWNDFNIGEILRERKHKKKSTTISTLNNRTAVAPFTEYNTDNQLCPSPVKYRSDLWRSPEEIRNISYVHLYQSDVYGLGNILYQTMTRHQPWTHKEPGGKLTTEDVAYRKLNGTVPTIPEQYRNTTKREIQILYAATVACNHPNPQERPTATQLAYGIGNLYNKLKNKERITRPMILDYIFPNIHIG